MARRQSEGLRIARLFRQYRQIPDVPRACDLDAICSEDEIEIYVMDEATPGFTACLLCPDPDIPCGIALAPGQSPGRTRFSIAHELGHFHIPSHKRRTPAPCREADMDARADTEPSRNIEWEANDFAAELLMPRRLFMQDGEGRDPILREIAELADPEMYDVSVTAAALRYVETTQEACAIVCAHDGVIEWVSKSDTFHYRIPWKGDGVPPGSSASAVFGGEQAMTAGERLDPYTWLEHEQRCSVELFESNIAIPSQAQVLSLLWVVPE